MAVSVIAFASLVHDRATPVLRRPRRPPGARARAVVAAVSAHPDFVKLLLWRVAFSIAYGAVFGYLLYLITDLVGVPTGDAGRLIGLATVLGGAAALVGVLLGGWLSDRLRRRRLFLLIGSAALLLGDLLLLASPPCRRFSPRRPSSASGWASRSPAAGPSARRCCRTRSRVPPPGSASSPSRRASGRPWRRPSGRSRSAGAGIRRCWSRASCSRRRRSCRWSSSGRCAERPARTRQTATRLEPRQQRHRLLDRVDDRPEESRGVPAVAHAVVEDEESCRMRRGTIAPSTTHGRSSARPTPSSATSGWLMIAAEPSTPSEP
ncbi:MFS transporter [Pseudolysinimonas kribbensis]|uniref:MFS transporter n=1 Tax=Pseudolysinimonas kribbensis TaxID=433641 RepID=UPI003D67F8D1